MNTAVRIENRAQLIYLLTEAAELEHGIMCCYLFTAYTLKNDTKEGVSEPQLRAIRRWRRLIRQIAVEEMLHLASVCNVLTAIGGAPQLRRANLPSSPKAYGASFRLALEPFNLQTLEQFIAIEKPVEVNGKGRPELPPAVQPRLTDIFSSERDYDTQGRLYRGIEDGIKYLSQKYGDSGLFIGPQHAQTANAHFNLPGLIPVTDLSSALAAIKIIVEQGEGASREVVDSHYSKFVTIYEEYRQALAEDPNFQPARPVLSNPYVLLPSDKGNFGDANVIDNEETADLCNLFDGCYELMVQMLGRLFVHSEETEPQCVLLAKVTEGIMVEVIDPLGNLLTTLPAGPSYPGMNAGPSFRLSRGASIPTHKEAAWLVFQERLHELSSYCRFLLASDSPPPALGRIRDAINKYADMLSSPAE